MSLTQINKAGLDELALDHVFTIGASGSSAYTFQGEGLNGTVNNPTLYLTRGKTYRFENGSGGHPIRIQSTSGASGTAYNTGVTNNAGSGTVIVEVQHDAPDVLYYQCTSHAAMNGVLYITGALADGGVTTAKIADNAVTTAKIPNGAITTAKYANDSITADHIAPEAVELQHLPHGTGSTDGKFLRANNGADPTFESLPDNQTLMYPNGGTAVTTSTNNEIQINSSNSKVVFDTDTGNTYNISFAGPSTLTKTSTFTLPEDGSNGQFIKTNGSGVLSFATVDLTNLSASNLTSGTVPDARISASSVTQHATSFNDNNIVNDISSLALKLNALQNATRYNTNSTYVDTFQDANGVGTFTNCSRNSNEYVASVISKSFYKPSTDLWTFTQSSTSVATNGPCTFAAWMKSSNGSNWTYNGSQGGGIMNLQTKDDTSKYLAYNIGYGSNNGKFGAHTPGVSDCNTNSAWSAPTNKWVLGVVRTGYNWSNGHVEIMHRAYDANSWTTDADSNGGTNNYGTLSGGTGRLFRHASNNYTNDFDNTHIAMMGFWNLSLNTTALNDLFNSGSPFDWTTSNGNYTATNGLQEYFKMDEGSGTTLTNSGNGGNATRQSGSGSWDIDSTQLGSTNATGNFVSNAITASSSTSKMGAVITFIDGYGSTTINTDLKVYLSADNGSNFSQANLVLAPNFATGVRMAIANDVTVTAGTQLKYKIEFANQAAGSKEVRVSGISLQF